MHVHARRGRRESGGQGLRRRHAVGPGRAGPGLPQPGSRGRQAGPCAPQVPSAMLRLVSETCSGQTWVVTYCNCDKMNQSSTFKRQLRRVVN